MVAGAGEVTVVDRGFLITMGRADAEIHAQHDGLEQMPCMHSVNPLPREISQCSEVLVDGKERRLEASHLAGRCRSFRISTPTDNPASEVAL